MLGLKTYRQETALHFHSVAVMVLLLLIFAPQAAFAACVGPAGSEGDIIYNDDHDMMQFCDDVNWIAMGASQVENDPQVGAVTNGLWCIGDGAAVQCNQALPGATAHGTDGNIQFNSANGLWSHANFNYTSVGDFIVGSYQLDDTGTGSEDNRIFFDVSKGAFRAGRVTGTQWDDANVGWYSMALGQGTTASGNYSMAMGLNTTASGDYSTAMGGATASGDYSTAMGQNTTASGGGSTAMGAWTTASGWYSTAMGRDVTAGNGTAGSGFGDGSMALGLIDGGVIITTPSQVKGIQSYGIFMGDQDGLVMTAENTMGLFGGQMVIDPAVPATQLSARGVLDLGAATDALVLPAGTTLEQPGAPVNGMIRYNTDNSKMEGYQAGLWQDIITGSASASAPDRGIQFNSSGVFTAEANFTYTSAGDFIVGSSQLDDTGTGTEDFRMFFDVSNGAFRAGYVNSTQWDAVNVGTYSTAMGEGTTASGGSSTAMGAFTTASNWYSTALGKSATASGNGSTALGVSTTASGDSSTAMGQNTIASGYASTAMGFGTTASGSKSTALGASTIASGEYSTAMGWLTNASGDSSTAMGAYTSAGSYSMAIGLSSVNPAVDPKVTGAQSLGIFMGNQTTVDLAAANTMGLFGGQMVIDPAVPATQLSARGVLDLGAATDALVLPAGTTLEQPGAPVNGMIRYNTDNSKMEGYQAGLWQDIITGSASASAPDRGIQFNSSGAFTAEANFTYTSAGDFIVGSSQIDDTGTGSEDSRMFFDVSNSAFRAGKVTGNEWDFTSSGQYSAAFGYNTTASGNYSMAMGRNTTASGDYSTAMGWNTIVSGAFSTVMGEGTTASGGFSTAMGQQTTASADISTAMGYNTTASGPESTAMGSSTTAGGDSSTAMGGGTTASGDTSTAMGKSTTASGTASTALGNKVTAGDGTAASGFGDGSMALGLIDDAVVITTASQVKGIQSMGIFMGDQDGLVMTAENTMGLFGGAMVIDPAVPATQLSARGVLDLGAATDALVLPAGTTLQQPGAPVNGMIRYNTDNSKMEGYQAGLWQDIITAGASASAPDRGIQFNSSGVFTAEANFTYTSAGDFIVGSSQLDDTGTGSEDNRIFFDTSKGAFRAGVVTGTQWDDANVGLGSAAMGYNTTASNLYSTALGLETTASGTRSFAVGRQTTASGTSSMALGYLAVASSDYSVAMGESTNSSARASTAMGNYTSAKGFYSTAMGRYTTASGIASTAMGRHVIAGNGTAASGFGDGSMALGLIDDAVTITTKPQVTGIQSYGIFMGDQDGGIVLSSANTMGLFGGQMVIDPAVPATQLSARGVLDLGAATDALVLPTGTDAQRPGVPVGGMFRYNTDTTPKDVVEYYDAESTAWLQIPTDVSGLPAGADRQIQFNSAGSFAADANFNYTSVGDFIVGSSQLDDSGIGDEDNRMFFDKSKGSFRAGRVTGSDWDTANVGLYSAAIGANTKASANYSVAVGELLDADGTNSFAMGKDAVVIGDYSAVFGLGNSSTPFPKVSGASSFGIFMGNQTGVDVTAANTMSLMGGVLAIGDVAASTGAQALELDVTGDIGATNYCDADGNDCFTAASVGSATAHGTDGNIQFNSANGFWSAANFNYTSVGDFIVGSYQLDGTGSGSEDSRMFFDVSKGAFRVGVAGGTEWDDANVGNFSAALGLSTTASGVYSTAMGNGTTASGLASTALGSYTSAGNYSMAIGLSSVNPAVDPKVTGAQSLGIFMGNQTGVDVTAANTMSLMGGVLAIGDVAASTGAQALELDVTGDIGAVNYCDEAGNDCFTAAGIALLAGGSVPAAGSDRQIQFNSNSEFWAATNFVYNSAGDFIVGSSQLDDTGTGSEDNRMFFDVSNSAFRAGSVDGNQWDFISSGQYSTALGNSTTASGWGSTALGSSTTASGQASTAMGTTTTASGNASTALGHNTTASGLESTALGRGTIASMDYSTAMGHQTTANGLSSTALGGDTTASGDYSTAMGYFTTASGDYSTVMGYFTTASGNNSTTMGKNTIASGNNSVAMGNSTTASGIRSTAMGAYVTAGDGVAASGFGDGSVAFGLIDNAVTITTPSQVKGIQSMGIFMGDQDALVMTANNTMGLFGGQMVIDPAVPATQLSARGVLDLGAATDALVLPAGTTLEQPGAPVNGMIRYNTDSSKMEGYQAGLWQDIITAGASASAPDRGIQFNSSGVFTAEANFTYTSAGDFIVGSSQLDDTGTGNEDNRMFFDVSKGAFRVGYADGTQWDDANVGTGSMAIGEGTTASGFYSTAMGGWTTASGDHSTAMGNFTIASEYAATALGANTIASGDRSTAMGGGTTASGFHSTAMGRDTTASGDHSTAMGMYTSAGSFSMAIGLTSVDPAVDPKVTGEQSLGIFMGNQTGVDVTAANTMSLMGGVLAIGDVAASTGAQALELDVTGDIGATNYCDADGNDCFTAASVGSATAHGTDGNIQFNSANGFWSAANFNYTSAGDFIVGSSQLDDTGTGTEDSRMFFDVSNSAFRAGSVIGNQWDFISSGQYSAAFGYGTIASGNYSTAMGRDTTASNSYSTALGAWTTASGSISTAMGSNTTASGLYSTALGSGTTASGNASTAMGSNTTASGQNSTAMGVSTTASGQSSTVMGRYVTAGDGTALSGFGDGSMALGLIDDLVTITTPSQVKGIQSYGIFMGDQDGLVMTAENTMGLFGGAMVIDPAVPATQLSARGVLDLGAATDALVLPAGTTLEQPGAPVNGMIRYNTDNSKMEGYQAGLWQDIITAGASASAPDRGIQFNSSGVFTAEANFTYTSAGDFIVGSSQLDDTGTGSEDYRMFYDTSKGAFRAGRAWSTQWDAANVGLYSTAMGMNTTASGDYSTAMGQSTTASGGSSTAMGLSAIASGDVSMAMGHDAISSGWASTALGGSTTASSDYSTAMGWNTTASGWYSMAMGRDTTASGIASTVMGAYTSAGNYSMAIGLTSVNPAVDPKVTGAQSLGIFMGNQTGVDVTAANTMSLMGGVLAIGDVAASTGAQALELDVTGDIGAVNYCDEAGNDCFTAAGIALLAGGSVPAAGADRQIQFNSNSEFWAATNFVYNSAGDFIVGSSQLDDTGTGSEDSRMFFDVSNSAFRAGFADGTQWDDANVGLYSTAIGAVTTASGNASTAMGGATIASGDYSTAMGWGAVAGGDYSTAMGGATTASGDYSTAMGALTVASGNASTAMGAYTSAGHYSMAIGLSSVDPAVDPKVTGEQSLGIFMGNQTGVDVTAANTMSLMGGVLAIGDVAASTGAQALELDVTGDIGATNYCDADGNDCFTAASVGTSSPAGADRQIQFNSGGAFAAEANFTYTAAGDFIVGSSQLDDTGTGSEDSRMLFDVSNSAFRAGFADGNQWDFTSSGQYSAAFGYNTTASGDISTAMGIGTTASGDISTAMGSGTIASGKYSTAMGRDTTASGWYSTAMTAYTTASGASSTAMGSNTTASGIYSTAMGNKVTVGDGVAASGFGDGSVAFGLIDEAVVITTPSQVKGIQSYGIFMGDQDGLVMTANNTMGLFGGAMVIDPAVPATQLSARGVLDLGAATDALVLPAGTTLEQPGAPVNGMIRYNTDSSKMEGYQAGLWQDIITAGASASAPDRGIQFNSGGSFAAEANFTYTSVGDFIVGSNQLDDTGTGSEDNRVFFDVSKGAFRAGRAIGTQWDDANVGTYSTAMGDSTTASGAQSTAMGNGTTASGSNSVAMGIWTTASGVHSTALGYDTTANKDYSTAMGKWTTASGYASMAMGLSTTASGYAGIAMGRSTVARGDYSTAMGRSTTASGYYSTALGYKVTAGDGTAGNGFGDGSMALGLIDDAVVITTASQVKGIQSYGIFMGDQDGLVMTAENTMGLFGGQMVIDPAVPATQLSARGVLDLGAATDALVLPAGTTLQQPGAPVNGMIRYNTDSSKMEGYQAGLWQDIITAGASASAPDRGVQFNSGGSFAAEANFTYTSAGDFIVGSSQLDDTGTGSEDKRVFFDVSKGAFRAGSVDGTQWDDVNVGEYSLAMGINTTASDWYSTAMGFGTTASGNSSTAIGYFTTASGGYSTAMGYQTQASSSSSTAIGTITTAAGSYSTAMGREVEVTAAGTNSFAIGLGDATGVFPKVSGVSSFGIFMGDQSGVDITAANTMSLMGGVLAIGDVAASTGDQALELDVTGDIGATNYCDADGNDCFTAASVGSATAHGTDGNIQFNSANGFWSDANFNYTSVGDFIVGSYQLDDTGTGSEDFRMFFDVSKGAFRMGRVWGTEWDDVNVGQYSAAFGYGTTASGSSSTALGWDTTASGHYSTALGFNTTASENYSTALGWNTTASGGASTAMGLNTIASGEYSTAMGQGTTASGWYSTAMGSSTTASGQNSTAMGQSTIASGEHSTAMGRKVTAGDGVTASGFGDGSMALGLIDNLVTITTPSQVKGIQSMGIFMGDQDGLVMTAENTMGLFGGQMVIDPAVPATQLSARGVLDLGAATDALVLPIGTDAQQPGAPVNGMIRYNTDNSKFEGYQAGLWQDIITASASASAPNRGIQFNSGGSFAAEANFTYTSAGDFIVGSYQLDSTGTGSEDKRMFFDVSKGAFRAGYTEGPEWDDANVGMFSTALGQNAVASGVWSTAMGGSTTASGDYSTALGRGTTASLEHSTALGRDTIASGPASTAMGSNTTASGFYSTAMGFNTTASGFYSTAMGAYTTASGDASTAMGAYTSAGNYSMAIGLTSVNPAVDPKVTGAQSLGIFMGNQTGVDVTQANAMVLMGGKFGIGDVTPDVELDVVGDIEYTGTLTDVSDRRLKTDITALNGGAILDKIMMLDAYSFTMKDDPDKRVEMGVMAQDLVKVFPELVRISDDEMGTMSVNYVGLIAPLIEAAQVLKLENEAMKVDISTLKAQQTAGIDAALDELRREVKGLKAHTGYGVGRASFEGWGLLVMLALFGGSVAFFTVGALRRRKPE